MRAFAAKVQTPIDRGGPAAFHAPSMKCAVFFLSLLLAAPVLARGALAAVTDDGLSPAANAAYLTASTAKPGTVVRPSGLQYRILRRGFGRLVTASDVVRIAYTIRLVNGTVADHTPSNLPTALSVGSAGMAGLSEALKLMHEGDRWELVIPAHLALGSRGTANGAVPPDQTLIIDLTLISATAAQPGDAAPGNPLSVWGYGNRAGAAFTIRP